MALVLTLLPGSTFNVAERRFLVEADLGVSVTVRELGGAVLDLTEREMTDIGQGVAIGLGLRLNPGQPRIMVEAAREIPIWRDQWAGDAPVALLAPAPLEHLESGLETCRSAGRVAFGSNAFEALHALREELDRQPCHAYLYASDEARPGPPTITWRATYLRWIEGRGGAHPAKMLFRPESTAKYASDNQGHWACFWEVTDLRRVDPDDEIPIRQLQRRTGAKLASAFIPRGPLVIRQYG